MATMTPRGTLCTSASLLRFSPANASESASSPPIRTPSSAVNSSRSALRSTSLSAAFEGLATSSVITCAIASAFSRMEAAALRRSWARFQRGVRPHAFCAVLAASKATSISSWVHACTRKISVSLWGAMIERSLPEELPRHWPFKYTLNVLWSGDMADFKKGEQAPSAARQVWLARCDAATIALSAYTTVPRRMMSVPSVNLLAQARISLRKRRALDALSSCHPGFVVQIRQL
mmetsp:Transcript_5356/g.11894  ORF Transcript_5356/g.11894 Transcript_5356/m.11894 type:complete len:233 (+) Transcript_5356:736-1434(+)